MAEKPRAVRCADVNGLSTPKLNASRYLLMYQPVSRGFFVFTRKVFKMKNCTSERMIQVMSFALLILLFGFAGCSGAPTSKSQNALLTRQEVTEDIEYTKKMLKNAYVGHRFQSADVFEKALANLETLKNSATELNAKQLCDQIENAISVLPDSHLFAAFPIQNGYSPCSRAGMRFEKSQSTVGDNLQLDPNKKWSLLERITPNGKRIKVLAISSFSGAGNLNDSHWKDFIDTSNTLARERYFVIDLRENGGGSDRAINSWIQNLLSGEKQLMPPIWVLQSEEAFQVRLNSYQFNKTRAKTDDDKSYQDKMIASDTDRLNESRKGKLARWDQQDWGTYKGKAPHSYTELTQAGRCISEMSGWQSFLTPASIFKWA